MKRLDARPGDPPSRSADSQNERTHVSPEASAQTLEERCIDTIRFLAVDGEKADGVDAALFESLCARLWAHVRPFVLAVSRSRRWIPWPGVQALHHLPKSFLTNRTKRSLSSTVPGVTRK